MPNHRKSAEHQRLVGRKSGVDAAGKRLPAPVVALPVADPPPPPPATIGAVGREHWERIFSANWVSPAYDVAAVTRLCEMYEDREAMRAALRKDGWMVWTAAGSPRANPLAGHLARLDAEIRRLEIEFGLTPAARSRLGYSEVRRVSRLDELMRKQRERR